MDFELAFAIFALIVSCASLAYTVACGRRIRRATGRTHQDHPIDRQGK